MTVEEKNAQKIMAQCATCRAIWHMTATQFFAGAFCPHDECGGPLHRKVYLERRIAANLRGNYLRSKHDRFGAQGRA